MKFLAMTLASVAFATALWAEGHVADADGDGVFSMEELLQTFPNITDDIFAQMDANGDGAIDADELAAAEAAGLVTAG